MSNQIKLIETLTGKYKDFSLSMSKQKFYLNKAGYLPGIKLKSCVIGPYNNDEGYLNLKGIVLTGADLENSWLCWIYMNNCYLEGANMKNVEANGIFLQNSNLSGCNMEGAKMINAQFQNSKLQGSNLSKTTLNGANFEGADLEGCDFSFSELTNVIFKNANIKNANFKNALLGQNSTIKEASNFKDAININFNYVNNISEIIEDL